MLKKALLMLLGAAICAASLGGCRSGAAAPEGDGFSYAFTDSRGKTVTLERRPEKVAVLFSSLADVWVTAGGTVAVTVGESVLRGFAAEHAVLVDAGSGHSAIDLEALAAAEPDLVIGTADYASQTEAADFCERSGIPAACFRVDSFEDYADVLKIFCELTERPELYETFGEEQRERIDACIDSVKNAAPARILFMRSGSSASSAKAKTADENFVCAMLAELGAQNIADAQPSLPDTLSTEIILREDPDYIFVSTMGDANAAEGYVRELFASAGWRELSAVRGGAYTFLPKELFQYKPNSRWAEAYEYLADILCPDRPKG